MAWISAEELAELVPCPPGEIRSSEELGLLERHEGDGLFASGDVHVVRLMAAFEEAGISLEEQRERTLAVPARIGINAGAVVAQDGDYFGRTVNIAARIADYARPREVLVSDDAERSASVAGVEFELVGDVPLKGVSRSVRLHRATRPGVSSR